jgi:hypothetical protein
VTDRRTPQCADQLALDREEARDHPALLCSSAGNAREADGLRLSPSHLKLRWESAGRAALAGVRSTGEQCLAAGRPWRGTPRSCRRSSAPWEPSIGHRGWCVRCDRPGRGASGSERRPGRPLIYVPWPAPNRSVLASIGGRIRITDLSAPSALDRGSRWPQAPRERTWPRVSDRRSRCLGPMAAARHRRPRSAGDAAPASRRRSRARPPAGPRSPWQ